MSFANLKKNRNKFTEELSSKITSKGDYSDDRYWQPQVDEAGNGYAVIRFLPAPNGEEMPYVKLYQHAFKNQATNMWYIQNSRTTIGEKDPVTEHNNVLWQTGTDSNKNIVRSRSRKLYHIANILVLKDPKNPENEGKVFLFKFGKKIFGKLEGALNPQFPDEPVINPFDMWEDGANFKLKIKNVEKQRSYDDSSFDNKSDLFDGDDAKKEEVYNQTYSLQAEIAEDKFKSYEELEKMFLRVIGESAKQNNTQADAVINKLIEGGSDKEPIAKRVEEDDESFFDSGDDNILSELEDLVKG